MDIKKQSVVLQLYASYISNDTIGPFSYKMVLQEKGWCEGKCLIMRDKYSLVRNWVVCDTQTENPCVPGSIPGPGTSKFRGLNQSGLTSFFCYLLENCPVTQNMQ